jgi:hypothetical protein
MQRQSHRASSRGASRGDLLIAAAFLCAGLLPIFAVLGVFGPDTIKKNAPDWVIYLTCSMFVGAGLWLPSRPSPGGTRAGQLLGGLVFFVLLIIGNWIAFGPGERECESSISLPFLELEDDNAGLACRMPFGWGAVLMNGIVIVMIGRTLLKHLGASWWASAIEKVGRAVVLIMLSPLVVVVLIAAFASGGKSALDKVWVKSHGRDADD